MVTTPYKTWSEVPEMFIGPDLGKLCEQDEAGFERILSLHASWPCPDHDAGAALTEFDAG